MPGTATLSRFLIPKTRFNQHFFSAPRLHLLPLSFLPHTPLASLLLPLTSSPLLSSTGAGREEAEAPGSLTFAGFAAFTTRIRGDCAEAIAQLRQSDMALAVVSGDSLLTSLHVAKTVREKHWESLVCEMMLKQPPLDTIIYT